MNDFDTKWKQCAAWARQAAPSDERPPIGFTTRVTAIGLRQPENENAATWERLLPGSLAGVLALLVICAFLELPHFHNPRLWQPGVENTVAQLVWSL
jgi:hypothetical protein